VLNQGSSLCKQELSFVIYKIILIDKFLLSDVIYEENAKEITQNNIDDIMEENIKELKKLRRILESSTKELPKKFNTLVKKVNI